MQGAYIALHCLIYLVGQVCALKYGAVELKCGPDWILLKHPPAFPALAGRLNPAAVADSLLGRAKERSDKGDAEGAWSDATIALALCPQSGDVYSLLGLLKARQRDHDGA